MDKISLIPFREALYEIENSPNYPQDIMHQMLIDHLNNMLDLIKMQPKENLSARISVPSSFRSECCRLLLEGYSIQERFRGLIDLTRGGGLKTSDDFLHGQWVDVRMVTEYLEDLFAAYCKWNTLDNAEEREG